MNGNAPLVPREPRLQKPSATLPRSPEQLNPDLLTRLLREAGILRRGRVSSLSIDRASQTSGIIGHTLRLRLRYSHGGDLPKTCIAKFPTLQVERRAYFQSLGLYAREALFYRELAAQLPLNIPRCYLALHDQDSGDTFLLLEEVESAQVGDRVAGCTVERAALALDAAAQLHIAWWRHPALEGASWLNRHDQAAFEARFHKSWQQLRSAAQPSLPVDFLHYGNLLSESLEGLARLWQSPATLIHRDYNLDNLLFTADGKRVFVIDWQFARRGKGLFDVAMFLCWNLPISLRRESEAYLLARYLQSLRQAGIRDYSDEACLADYRLALQECLARIVAIMGAGLITEAGLQLLLDTILRRTLAALGDHGIDEMPAASQ